MVGGVGIGGNNPVRIQSMVIPDTLKTEAAFMAAVVLFHHECEIVRFTTASIKEAENLKLIKAKLRGKAIPIPIVADVHFTPNAAIEATKYADKVRINPGNFADRKRFESIEYSESEYQNELLKVREKLIPFIQACIENKVAVRIGVNHGSLSDRVTSMYGDTPLGMVKSATEFIEIFRDFDFHDIVVSLKSSNPIVMVQAYRLFCLEMIKNNWDYPLHLGVTEAGDGEDGRIKSALGIGLLMEDGIGDTIRVSLTEDAKNEIPVARKLADRYVKSNYQFDQHNIEISLKKRKTNEIERIGGTHKPVVLSSNENSQADFIFQNQPHFCFVDLDDENAFDTISKYPEKVVVLNLNMPKPFQSTRKFFKSLNELEIKNPIILKKNYADLDKESTMLFSSIDLGGTILEGNGDGIWIKSDSLSTEELDNLSFGILQATRTRITKTEFISCPSCGRTQFDLQETTAKIKEKTKHLKGLKIGIMGCIVNGPGEMADADYGYVGSGKNKISLYKKQNLVKSNIPTENAVEELIKLIKENGDWKED